MGRHPEIFVITMSVVLSAASVVVAQDAGEAAGPETLATGPSTLATGPSTLAAGPATIATGPTTLATGPSTSVPLPSATVPIPSGTVPIPPGTVPIPSGTVPIPPGTVPIPADLQQGTGTTAGNAGSVDITNAVVLSIDPQQRQLVIRNELGNTRTVVLGDNLAGFSGITPGDSVVLSLQRQPTGLDRVLSISLGGIVPSQSVPAGPAVSASLPAGTATAGSALASGTAGALRVFSDRVATLSDQAAQVDRLWSRLRGVCDVSVDGDYSSSREWLSLWEGQARVDLSSGTCRDLYDQVISAGEAVNTGMAEAEDQARRADLLPGAVRQTQQAFRMDWLGWGSAPPARLG
jgi:hypothetical protein